jgi:hypothetical protein
VVLRDMRALPEARALLEESLPLNRQVGDSWAVANVLSSLAEVCLEQQDSSAVMPYLQESLQINLDLEDGLRLPLTLSVSLALPRRRITRGRLWCLQARRPLFVESWVTSLPSEEKQLEIFLAPARASLSPEEQAASFALGAAMSFEEALAEARRQ